MTSEPETIEQAFKRLYVARFVEKGFPAEMGIACYEAVNGCYEDMTPEEAADEEMSYFDAD